MKLNENFVLRQVADTWVVLPHGDATLDFNGMLTLNESGAMLWNILAKGAETDELIAALTSEYSVSAEMAKADIEEFLSKLRNAGCID